MGSHINYLLAKYRRLTYAHLSLKREQKARLHMSSNSVGASGAKREPAKITAPSLQASKRRGEKISCLTAYDYPSALMADQAGMELILVGDSLANTALGYDNTLPEPNEEMSVALKAVRRGVEAHDVEHACHRDARRVARH